MTNLGPPAPPTRVGEPVGFSRTTRDGRRLHYELKVLQQPERARACGSGPKSSADRRPVDPPPVVQMKVFSGLHRENAEDITFAYNADFFLYASLHHDTNPQTRPNTTNGPPVLTGLPVSSMILLDRPEEAGYFIFSDLSVRHEGSYYLSFALMEEVKDERDKDEDEPMSGTDEITGPDAGSGRHFQFRTQVQTDVFDVFSAKKFPGLQESTALSRTVAEQGCRVRIRRDVRMRRREKGGKKELAAREDDHAQRAKADAAANRDRAPLSNEAPYRPSDISRRPSGPGDAYQHRPSFPASEPSPGGRPPQYAHMAPYPPIARSIPNSPPYHQPPPPHAGPFPPRLSYNHPYANAERRSPPMEYRPPASQPRDPREGFSYRGPEPARGPPMLAPKLEPKLEADVEQKRDTLPPIRTIHGAAAPSPRRSSYHMPRLLPQPQIKREPGHMKLPPLAPSPYSIKNINRRSLPPTPITPSSSSALSRKRSAEEANLSSMEDYRLQNGRRQEEQPRNANYKMEPHGQITPPSVLPKLMVRDRSVKINVKQDRQGPPTHWHMSPDLYNRASDSDINVDFPGLHQTGNETQA